MADTEALWCIVSAPRRRDMQWFDERTAAAPMQRHCLTNMLSYPHRDRYRLQWENDQEGSSIQISAIGQCGLSWDHHYNTDNERFNVEGIAFDYYTLFVFF